MSGDALIMADVRHTLIQFNVKKKINHFCLVDFLALKSLLYIVCVSLSLYIDNSFIQKNGIRNSIHSSIDA